MSDLDGSRLTGRRLGVYDVGESLGAGGMGEVYRARDTRLDRDVAIKVLPHAFAADEERIARFAREARLLASLNHPNIAAIYGFEDSGGVRALVLEFVEGETLAARIARGPVPLKAALTIARAIAEALDAAHEKGVIHRDLKPANVMLTRDGIVKVLDFGLAKVADDATADVSVSPVATDAGTRAGIVLGTAAYMSPEQARGQTLDKRTDIWAFGCVLYEMLAGRSPFIRPTVSDTVAAILEHDPDWRALPETTPRNIRQLLHRCLEKNLKDRRRDIGDLRIELDDALSASTSREPVSSAMPAAERVRQRRSEAVAWSLAALAIAAMVITTFYPRRSTIQPEAIKFSVFPPAGTTFPFAGGAPWPSISPDGRHLAFVAVSSEGEQRLWIQALNATAARPLQGTEGAMRPFWSPDSRSLGFFADGKLLRIDLPDGTPQALAAVPYSGGVKGTWGRDVIAFQQMDGLYRVSPSGGPATALAGSVPSPKGERVSLENLSFLPDGRRYVYLKAVQQQKRQTCIGSIDPMPHKCVLTVDTPARYAQPGYLLFVQDAILRAMPFDLERLEVAGDALPISDTPINSRPGFYVPPFSASDNGVLAYHPSRLETQLQWVDRSGNVLEAVGEVGMHQDVEVAPDARRLVFTRADLSTGNVDLWLYDLARGTSPRFTFDAAFEQSGVFSPDGLHIAFTSDRAGSTTLYRKPVSGAGQEEMVTKSTYGMNPKDWSSDGRLLLYQIAHPKTGWDLWAVPVSGDRKPFAVVDTEHGEREGQFSPDVRWIAYDSTESGRREVWVQPFPPTGRKWQVSTSGGFSPRWRGDGKELFYVAANGKLMAVPVTPGESLEFGAPVALFQTMFREAAYGSYSASVDGRRFLVNVPPEGWKSSPITVVINWTAALRK